MMKHIAVIDDDRMQLMLFSAMLANYQISTYSNPLQALKDMPGTAPDLILVDLGLPFMSGFELFHHLRETKEFDNTPVVAISAQVSSNTETKCEAIGFLDLIAKPVNTHELRNKIAHYLSINEWEFDNPRAER